MSASPEVLYAHPQRSLWGGTGFAVSSRELADGSHEVVLVQPSRSPFGGPPPLRAVLDDDRRRQVLDLVARMAKRTRIARAASWIAVATWLLVVAATMAAAIVQLVRGEADALLVAGSAALPLLAAALMWRRPAYIVDVADLEMRLAELLRSP